MGILQNYSEYLSKNSRSQICRIFGLFEFKFDNFDKSIKLIVMESLDPIYSDSKLRKYDLKGSTSDRSNIKPEDLAKITKEQVVEEVMLDNDFTEVSPDLAIPYHVDREEDCPEEKGL